jgi:hypothetical protein
MSVPKWTIPLTCVGLGGLGAILLTERGRRLLRSGAARWRQTPGQLAAWNDAAQQELDHIQQAVKNLEQSLGT